MSDQNTKPYLDPLARASHVVPIGIHLAEDGSVALDPVDAAMIEDVRVLFGEIVRQEGRKPHQSLQEHLRLLGETMHALLMRVADDPDDPNAEQAATAEDLLAATFDRFPNFINFDMLADGSGDPLVDVSHPDHELANATESNLIDAGKGVQIA